MMGLRKPTLEEAVILGFTLLFIAYILRQFIYMIPADAISNAQIYWLGWLLTGATVLGVFAAFWGLSHMILDAELDDKGDSA